MFRFIDVKFEGSIRDNLNIGLIFQEKNLLNDNELLSESF